MKMKSPFLQTHRLHALLMAALLSPIVQAADIDISNEPLATRPEVKAKPNLLFILDNSGSMNWSYMPDDLGRSYSVTDEPYSSWYGYRASQCNGTAYDPDTEYTVPIKANGDPYPAASFSAAKEDGFNDSSSTYDLTDSYYYTYGGSQPRMGWAYTSSGVVNNTFYQECSSTEGNDPGAKVFTKIKLSSTSAQAQNYANWFSYYRRRYLLMRTAMGRAVKDLDSNYRVGFSTISDTSATDGTNYFRDIKDFSDTQKTNFYSSLYTVTPNGSTPLRSALAKAGRYFAKKVSNQAYDPVQYSCQRNYALLSTDGYWNGGNGVKLDGTAIGQQDGLEERPMRDDAVKQSTEVITYTTTATRNLTSSTQTRTRNWSRTETTVAATKGTGGCSSSRYLVTTTSQRYTQSQTQYFVTPQSASASYTRTTVTTEGVVTSGPTDSSVSYGSWSNTASATTMGSDTGDATLNSDFVDRNVNTSCVSSPSQTIGTTTYTNPSAGSWSSWSPSRLSYSGSTPVVGTWTAGTPVVTDTSDNGTPNTLADAAQYYYATDLRTTTLNNCSSSSSGSTVDVCNNIVPASDTDAATWQHMNTFTIGLGLKGTLDYSTTTLNALKAGTLQWPSPTNASSTTSSGGDATNIDDLWHAALNGRGNYYSALSASELSNAIKGVVQTVAQNIGASSAASTSSLELVAGENNFVYRASYTTNAWFGDLEAFSLNGETAAIAATATWSAKSKLNQKTAASRKIYFKGSTGLTALTWANLTATQQGYFNNICTKDSAPAQCSTMTSTNKTYANSGERLLNYLRGDRTHEAQATVDGVSYGALYRARTHLLGDIINGAPVHVGRPPFSYSDTGYADFVTAQRNRKAVVYVAANDGMLHAFSADSTDGGEELWAYVPGAVMPNLYRLADDSYGTNHQYFVDGAPVMGDIKVGDDWKTILVGGLNKGGKSYYALDITDPANPKTLWEFTDANMGLSYGNPIITKRADGTWIVALTSGLNNSSGDGKGHLYILNANTGALIMDLPTTAGSSSAPSGLGRINAWIDNPADNTAKRFYGADQLGNVWRFDVDSLTEPHQSAMLLAQLRINASTPQPISVKPMTVEVSGKPVVIVATGRYMGVTDITDTTQQSIYAIRDPLTSTGWGDVRAGTQFVEQTFTLDGSEKDATTATLSSNSVDWSTKAGWRVDFPHSKERVFSNMGLQLGTLAIGTAIPSGDACVSGGASWRYYLNVGTGSAISKDPPGKSWNPDSLIVGLSWVKDTNGNVRIIYQNSDSTIVTEVPPTAPTSGAGSVHRTSWRELVD